MNLKDAIAKYVENGDVISLGGFTTNRKPYAAVNEILRQGQKILSLKQDLQGRLGHTNWSWQSKSIHKLLHC